MKKFKSQAHFQRALAAIDTEDKARAWLRDQLGASDEDMAAIDMVNLIPSKITKGSNTGMALFTFYGRCTCPGPSGEIIVADVELTNGLEAAPEGVNRLLMTGLKIAAAHGLRNGLVTRVGDDDGKKLASEALELYFIESEKAKELEAKLAEREAEHARQIKELHESHANQLANMLAQQDKTTLKTVQRASNWKAACKGIRQRYQHWKVAAITAYNVLEGRSDPVAITAPITPEPAVEAAPEKPKRKSAYRPKNQKYPGFSSLSPEEKTELRRQWGAKRWAGSTPEQRKEHMAMMKSRQNPG